MLHENLIESELFGYEKGAFTGAASGGKIGKIELANNGTLFLDEIGELPPHIQSKLLQLIQEKTIERLSGNKRIELDFRLLVATNRSEAGIADAVGYLLGIAEKQERPIAINLSMGTVLGFKDGSDQLPSMLDGFSTTAQEPSWQ